MPVGSKWQAGLYLATNKLTLKPKIMNAENKKTGGKK